MTTSGAMYSAVPQNEQVLSVISFERPKSVIRGQPFSSKRIFSGFKLFTRIKLDKKQNLLSVNYTLFVELFQPKEYAACVELCRLFLEPDLSIQMEEKLSARAIVYDHVKFFTRLERVAEIHDEWMLYFFQNSPLSSGALSLFESAHPLLLDNFHCKQLSSLFFLYQEDFPIRTIAQQT